MGSGVVICYLGTPPEYHIGPLASQPEKDPSTSTEARTRRRTGLNGPNQPSSLQPSRTERASAYSLEERRDWEKHGFAVSIAEAIQGSHRR